MKRSAALQPLSREHHAALKLAKACECAAGDAGRVSEVCLRVIDEFRNQLRPHFLVEEREWLPLLEAGEMKAMAARTLAEHDQLRSLAGELEQRCAPETLQRFGSALAAHVRFEERELFPVLEKLS